MSIASSTPITPSSAPTALISGSATDIPLSALRRFSVDEYHALIEAGFFADDENYELLRGLLVHKMGKKRAHTLATQRLRELLEKALTGFYADAQEPVTINDSEPEPDVSVVRGKRDDYLDRHPLGTETPLVVEVAEATLSHDRGVKKAIYAEAGIPIYWIVNLIDRQIEIYTQPSGPTQQPDYAKCEIVSADGEVPLVIDSRELGRLRVKDILP